MRIAHLICNFEHGGVSPLVVGLAGHLVERGHEVDVIQLDRATGSAHEQRALAALKVRGVSSYNLNRMRHHPGLRAMAQLWRLIRSRGYDVVHSHLSLPDTIVGLLRLSGTGGFDHVTTIHTARDGRGNLSKWCIRRARAVYCSESARLDNPLYSSDNTVVPNGIDLAEYRERLSVRSTARRSLGLDEGTVAIVSVAELRPTKNYDCAIDAIALVARREPRIDVRYFICGAGPELGRLKKRVSDLEIPCYVSFLGRRTDIPDILTAADLFLSASSQEGMPLSVIEALAAGLPCVLSPIAEHLEVTAGMDGCYFPAANRPGALATVLEGVLAGPESHRRFSDSREQLLHRLSLTACAAAYDDVYRRSAGALGLAGAPDVDHLSKTPPPGQTA